ncbi:FAS-associated death domain protein [Hyperolius riggenbachi]|uniref:FAS-associated death domain protein n=1 Tax=Hyperolius riggenbachi TaxID=752182 RepID=UPI0035A2CF93
MEEFRVALLKISERLSEQDFKDMKFLCQEKIVKKKLEAITRPTELFTRLIEQENITKDKPDFLIFLLQHIGRNDLIGEVDKSQTPLSREQAGVQTPLSREQAGVQASAEEGSDQLLQAFDIVCDNVGRDWRRLLRFLGVTDITMEQVQYANPYNLREQIRQCLREWRKKKGEDANISALLKGLEKCRMRLVIEKITDELNLSAGSS